MTVAKSLVVAGCGAMGCDVAAIFLAHGWGVQAVTRDPKTWAARRSRVQRSLQQLGVGHLPDRLQFVSSLADVSWASVVFVLESVPEDFDLKRKVFSELDRLAPDEIPLLTNTSGLRISEISHDLDTRGRMAGLHFFMPAHLVPAVEVVKGEHTDDQIIEKISSVIKSVKRIPIKVSKDVPGFLANRIQHALMREAFAVIDEGLGSPEDVDAAVRFGFGFRYAAAGPILLKELSGLDTQLAAGRSIYPSLHNGTEPSRVLTRLVDAGRYGTKVGRGFWDWTPEGIAQEQQRFESALIAAAKILEQDVARMTDQADLTERV